MMRVVVEQALHFDQLEPGQVFRAGPRQVSRADIDAFSALSGDQTALHSDQDYARTTPFGGVVAHGALVLAVATGLAFQTGVFEGTVLAVRSMEVRFERPVFPGDALTLELEVDAKDPHPRPDRGRVTFRVRVRNQRGESTLAGAWTLIMRRSGGAASGGRSVENQPEPPI